MGMWQRWRNRGRRAQVQAEIDEELAAHLAMAEDDGLRDGLTAQEAHRAARVRFGNVARTAESAHRSDVALPFDGWGTALRATLRGLRRSPGFAVTVLLTLAVGIGATTALFTLVYDVMLKPLPFPAPGRLVVIQEKVAEWSNLYPVLPVSANHFTNWERNNRSFAAMAALEEGPVAVGSGERAREIGLMSATTDLFRVLGVMPRLGRAFVSADARAGSNRVVVLTDATWREQFGADPSVLGRTIRLGGYPYTVIGIMPRSFHMIPVPALLDVARGEGVALPVGAITPLIFSPAQLAEVAEDLDYAALGRLKPGVSVAAATSDLNALQRSISATLPPSKKETLSILLTPLQRELVGNSRMPMLILLAAVAGLLLVGCVNIANLLLARSVSHRQQMALISALGAGRAAVLRMAFRETAVLATAGGAMGIGLAATLVPWMQQYLPAALKYRGTLHLDWAGGGCALVLAFLAMFVTGAVPAWIGMRAAPQEVLHSEARLATEHRGSRRARRALMGVEAAMCAALLLTTGLMTDSVEKLLHENRGFEATRTMTAQITLPGKQYEKQQSRTDFFRELLMKLASLPGVEHAAIASLLPLTGDGWGGFAVLPGDTRPVMQMPMENFRWVSPGYFQAIGLPLRQGRLMSPDDWGRDVAVISEKTAKTLWPGTDAIGRKFSLDGGDGPFTVVGVVGDARTITLAKPDPMLIYVPYWYRTYTGAGIVIRTRQDPATMVAAIRKTIWSIDPGIPVPAMRTLGALVTDSVADQRFERDLLTLFAASALLLAALGVYGVVSYSVTQRRREIGLRLALGAPRASMYTMVLRDGLPPVAAGIAAGILLVYAMAHLLRALLFGVTVYDPAVTVAAAVILLTLAAAACLLPARRASAVDPMDALRE